MKKVRAKKEYGTWYYNRIKADNMNCLDADVYELYDESQNFVTEFGSYGDMKYYIETGVILG